MTIPQLIQFIRSNVKGTTTATVLLEYSMDAKGKMRKTNNPFIGLGIVNRSALNGILGYNYGTSINNLAKKEGAEIRDAKPHPWGDMDENRLFRIHRSNGSHYLSMKLQGYAKPEEFATGYFYADGKKVEGEKLKELLSFVPVKKKSSTQSDLVGEVKARDYKLSNIVQINMLKRKLTIGATEVEQETEKVKTAKPTEIVLLGTDL